jgi:hypothetical protein
MAGVRRYFTAFPGLTTLAEIEGVAVVDEQPVAAPLGAGTGVVLLVGEFERGPLERPTRVFGQTDLSNTFGGLGWTAPDGRPYQYAVAARSAGSATPWNGNGWMELRNKRHAGLIICRVDNSPGTVEFRRLAALLGGVAPFNLEPGQTLVASVDGGAPVTGTFSAGVAQLDASGATYPTGFVGGETLEVRIDRGTTQVVSFTAADQSLAQVVARINSATASSIAADNAGQLRLSSVRRGYSASIEVVGGSARADLGLPTAPVQQQLTLTISAPGTTAAWSATFSQVINGVTTPYVSSYTSDASPTNTEIRDGLLAGFEALGIPNVASLLPSSTNLVLVTMAVNKTATSPAVTPGGGGTATFTATTVGVRTQQDGTGNVANIDAVQHAEAAAILAALTGVGADQAPDGRLRIFNDATSVTGTISISNTSTATGLGFTHGASASAGVGGLAGTIPTGTLLRDTTTQALWMTIEDVTTTATGSTPGGPYTVRVRPAVDDDTTPTANASAITQIVSPLYTAFAVTNPLALSRLTGPQMDARYQRALDATIDTAGEAYNANILRSARKTANIQAALRLNGINTTASGHRARKVIVSPPIGTSRADARASSGVGVGATRDQRVFYCFPGLRTYVPEIAEVGAAGGTGFTADGIVQVPSDGFYAAVRSILPPEENAGQQLSDTNYGPLNALGLEEAYDKGFAGGVGLVDDDYKQFKASGIIAPRIDRSAGICFQSDVTSVDPATQPALADAKRRFFGDFLSDSLLDIGAGYSKKLGTPRRRNAFMATTNLFLELLKSPNQPDSSRLEEYRVRNVTTNEQRGLGHEILEVKVRQHASMDFITFRLTSGTTVTIEETN